MMIIQKMIMSLIGIRQYTKSEWSSRFPVQLACLMMKRLILVFILGCTGLSQIQGVDLYVSQGNSIIRIDDYGNTSLFADNLFGVKGLAFDKNGFLYASIGANIMKYDSLGHSSLYASGFDNTAGIAFDSIGNLYLAQIESIIKIDTQGNSSTFATLSAGAMPIGIAFDKSDNLYFGDNRWGTIDRILPDGTVSIFVPNSSFPQYFFDVATGICFDSNGLLATANRATGGGYGRIWTIQTDGSLNTLSMGFYMPYGIAYDSSDVLYVADSNKGNISKVYQDGTKTNFVTGLNNPTFIAFAPVLLPEASSLWLATTIVVFSLEVSRRKKWRKRDNS